MNATRILEQRLLAVFDQALTAALPAAWSELQPARASDLRPAAAVLLRVSEEPTAAEMAARLRGFAETVDAHREGREEKGAAPLLREVASLVERVETTRDPAAGPLGLEVLQQAGGVALDDAASALQPFLPQTLGVTDDFLTQVARSLLRATARSWAARARREEREEGS